METRKAKYGTYGEVIVLELGQHTSKIQTNPNDEFSYMWVKTEKLVFSVTRAKKTVAVDIETLPGPAIVIVEDHGDVISKALATAPVQPTVRRIAEATSSDWSNFVAYLQGNGYSFYVQTREAAIEKAEQEYIEWTNGEILPDNALYVHEGSIGHTWRLRFPVVGDLSLPFDVAPMGTVGRSFAKRQAQGLRRDNGQIDVNFASIAEQLVRAGLRVTTPGSHKEAN